MAQLVLPVNIINPCPMISVTAVRLIHSAVPNTSDLARCVLQQQRSAATGIIRM